MSRRALLGSLKALHAGQAFRPSALAILTNPYFFIRRGLFRGIDRHAHRLRGRLLDFGCGRKPYQSLFAVSEYVGMDIASSGHDHAGESIDVFYDGTHIPFPDGHFDSVFASEVLEHVFNLDEVLGELWRVMKPGAMALFTLPFVWAEHEAPYDCARYTSFAMKRALERQGFTILTMDKAGGYIEVIFQMCNAYVFENILPSNRWLRQLMVPIAVAPTTAAGLLLARLLPADHSLFLSHIIVAQKPADAAPVALSGRSC
jgi:SAM-dependent methyltransferase